MSPEGDDGRLSVQFVLLPREVDDEEPIDRLSREPIRRLAENAAERRREELHLRHMTGPLRLLKSANLQRLKSVHQKTLKHLIEDAQRLQTLPKPAGGVQTDRRRVISSQLQDSFEHVRAERV